MSKDFSSTYLEFYPPQISCLCSGASIHSVVLRWQYPAQLPIIVGSDVVKSKYFRCNISCFVTKVIKTINVKNYLGFFFSKLINFQKLDGKL